MPDIAAASRLQTEEEVEIDIDARHEVAWLSWLPDFAHFIVVWNCGLLWNWSLIWNSSRELTEMGDVFKLMTHFSSLILITTKWWMNRFNHKSCHSYIRDTSTFQIANHQFSSIKYMIWQVFDSVINESHRIVSQTAKSFKGRRGNILASTSCPSSCNVYYRRNANIRHAHGSDCRMYDSGGSFVKI